jgi:hypothetical protein
MPLKQSNFVVGEPVALAKWLKTQTIVEIEA